MKRKHGFVILYSRNSMRACLKRSCIIVVIVRLCAHAQSGKTGRAHAQSGKKRDEIETNR